MRALRIFRYIVVGLPQLVAVLLLFGFFMETARVARTKPFTEAEQDHIWSGRQQLAYGALPRKFAHTPLVNLAAAAPLKLEEWRLTRFRKPVTGEGLKADIETARLMLRSLFLLAGIALGVSVWYVARRLYGNAGGYVALVLYCCSPPMVLNAASIGETLPAAWGIFGVLFGGIALSHNLYAPWRKWIYRTLLVAIAAALGIASHPAAMLALPVAFLFMLYLSPGRRFAAIFLGAVATIIGFVLVLAAYGFAPPSFANSLDLRPWLRYQPKLSEAEFINGPFLLEHFGVVVLFLAAVALITYIGWRRTRYFGNTAPLLILAGLIYLALVTPLTATATIWALPFLYVFIGGICADLFESRFGKWAIGVVVLLLAEQGWMCWQAVRAASF